MNKQGRLFTWLLILIPSLLIAQQKDTLIKKLDSLSNKTDSVGGKQKNNLNAEAYNENTKITVHTYFILVADDIKQQLTSPFRATSSDWLKVGGFGLITTGCVLFADRPVNRLAMDIRNKSSASVSVSTYVTNFGGLYEGYTLAAFAAYGYIFKKEKTKTTTFLATQAYISAAIIETGLKYLTGRQRPSYYDPLTGKNSPTWHGPLFQFKKDKNGFKPDNTSYSSFPSGHTTVAFAAATVFAMEYKNSTFAPIVAYSAASLIGLSRLMQNAHWASDVLVGAVLGYLCGRQVVNNYHRYSKIQSAKKKNTISFTLNYFNGSLLPGFVYKFR
ncbi:MAG: phosphatase PAP2 family protein [Bacteroidota bacterium]|nr:phosphatase PAP2 family protein [Bacteroidota bacterium]MDP4251821.1 phosphatase PAP2 family protein [Bacteroidota bacterium]